MDLLTDRLTDRLLYRGELVCRYIDCEQCFNEAYKLYEHYRNEHGWAGGFSVSLGKIILANQPNKTWLQVNLGPANSRHECKKK
ncbi:hypothetical protein BJX68DRAFT_227926 [Aspergillus pseudodeflectus]|uniref:C2H2-type domain-containing protein n=1 Tax=Aspergillus pseudodeflectus TaxID=176178 RepID=A0ABR4L3Q5_9EURO